jgi:transposase
MSNFVGLDVSKEKTSVCVRDSSGGIVLAAKVATDPEAIVACLAELGAPPERVILETGRMSNWLHNSLVELGPQAICVDARQAHAVLSQMHNKTDSNDAAMLAELARTGFYRQVTVKSRAAQLRRTLLQARDLMIRQRLDVDNTIRGLLANLGLKLPKLRRRFPDRVASTIEDRPELRVIMQPPLQVRAGLVRALAELDRKLSRVVRNDAHCRRLMSVPGVGAVTAFAFVATVDDSHPVQVVQSDRSISWPDAEALSVGRTRCVGAHQQARGSNDAHAALRGGDEPDDPREACRRWRLAGVGSIAAWAHRPQEGLRRPGPPHRRADAPDVDRRDAVRASALFRGRSVTRRGGEAV